MAPAAEGLTPPEGLARAAIEDGQPFAVIATDGLHNAVATGPAWWGQGQRVEWSPDHSAVLVVTDDANGGRRYFVVRVGQRVPQEITQRVESALSVEWVGGRVPGAAIQFTPTGTTLTEFCGLPSMMRSV